jgi:hypothetical protein
MSPELTPPPGSVPRPFSEATWSWAALSIVTGTCVPLPARLRCPFSLALGTDVAVSFLCPGPWDHAGCGLGDCGASLPHAPAWWHSDVPPCGLQELQPCRALADRSSLCCVCFLFGF